MEAYIPSGRGLPAIGEYIEANSTEGYQIIQGLEQMKVDHLLPPKKGQALTSLGSPEPRYTPLPNASNASASASYANLNAKSDNAGGGRVAIFLLSH